MIDGQAQLVQLLADIAGVPVYRAESRHDPNYAPLIANRRAFTDGTNIVVRPEIADNLLRLSQIAAGTTVDPSMQVWKNTARDLWALSHEMGHFRKGFVEHTPEARSQLEDQANIWALNHLKPLARKMGLSKEQARSLYRALPQGYRAWHQSNRWSPDTRVPPRPMGGE